MISLELTVYGEPVGQGAISYNRSGYGFHKNAKKLEPWRDAIRVTARNVIAGDTRFPLTGPVYLDAFVTVRKPTSAPKRRRTWPITRSSSDWDHLGRAISDALTGIAWKDDSQIVGGRVDKAFPGETPYALDRPGVVIHIQGIAEGVAA